MDSTTYYEFDNQRIYTKTITIDPYAALPQMATPIAPPATTGSEVAYWQGINWVVLAERPHIITPPVVPEDNNLPTLSAISKIDYLRLFTQAERIAIYTFAQTNPIARDYQYMLDSSTIVSLNDIDIASGLELFEDQGIISTGRAAQILTNQPPS